LRWFIYVEVRTMISRKRKQRVYETSKWGDFIFCVHLKGPPASDFYPDIKRNFLNHLARIQEKHWFVCFRLFAVMDTFKNMKTSCYISVDVEVKKTTCFHKICFPGFCTISLFFISSPHRAPLPALPQGSWTRSSFHPEPGPLFPSAPVVCPLRHVNGNGISSDVIVFFSWNPKWREESIGESGGKSREVESEIRIIVSRLVARVGQPPPTHTHKWKVWVTILLLHLVFSRPIQFLCAWFEFITIWNKKCRNKSIDEYRCISRFRRKHANPRPTFSDAEITTLHFYSFTFLFVHPRPAKRRLSN